MPLNVRYLEIAGDEVAIRADERRRPRFARRRPGRGAGPDRLRSRRRRGSRAVRAVARQPDAGEAANPARTPAGTAATRVLLVDDHEDDVLLVRDLLARAEQAHSWSSMRPTRRTAWPAALRRARRRPGRASARRRGRPELHPAGWAPRPVARRLILLSDGAAPGLDLAAIEPAPPTSSTRRSSTSSGWSGRSGWRSPGSGAAPGSTRRPATA